MIVHSVLELVAAGVVFHCLVNGLIACCCKHCSKAPWAEPAWSKCWRGEHAPAVDSVSVMCHRCFVIVRWWRLPQMRCLRIVLVETSKRQIGFSSSWQTSVAVSAVLMLSTCLQLVTAQRPVIYTAQQPCTNHILLACGTPPVPAAFPHSTQRVRQAALTGVVWQLGDSATAASAAAATAPSAAAAA